MAGSTRRTPRVRAGLIRAAAGGAVLLTLTVAGCAGSAPDAVAYVNGTKITQKQLNAAYDGVAEVFAGVAISRTAVANVLIHGEIAKQLAAKNSITITDADREGALQGSNLTELLVQPDAKAVAFDVADQQIVSRKLGSDAYLSAVRALPVTINPRFGVLNPADHTINSALSGSLAEPQTPSPSPPG